MQLNAVFVASAGTVFVGYNIDRQNFTRQDAFPIGVPRSSLYLNLSYQLDLDEAGYLRVASSFVGLFSDAGMSKELLHFDYERDKPHGYPEAHLQVAASSVCWDEVLAACQDPSDRKRKLAHLHIPVGGRRFRPTLEDALEFVLCERIVAGRPDWADAIEASRAQFATQQLRAAIRRSPHIAAEALAEFGPTS